MPFMNTNNLPEIERLPGWSGRYFHTRNMTDGIRRLRSRAWWQSCLPMPVIL
jgi:hypothetical protein